MTREDDGSAGPGVEGGTILVVEDEQLTRDSLVQVLALRGHHVTAAATREEAQVLLGADPPFDAVVLDLKLGRRKSFDLIADLSSRPVPHGPIVVTGTQDPGDRAECLARGALHVFAKPYETHDLLEAVGAEVRRMRRNRSVAARDLAAVSNRRELSPERLAWLAEIRAAAAEWGLTRRELDTLQLALDGLSSAQIAVRLGISHETVRTHIKRLREKCQVGIKSLRQRFGPPPPA